MVTKYYLNIEGITEFLFQVALVLSIESLLYLIKKVNNT